MHRVGDNLDVVRCLAENGADLNARDHKGSTPLHAVARGRPNPALVRFLVERGADPNAKDNNGHTPVYFAVNAHTNANKAADRNRCGWYVVYEPAYYEVLNYLNASCATGS